MDSRAFGRMLTLCRARLVETIVFSPIRIREHANEMQELSDLQELFELKCNSLNDFYLSVKRHSTLTKYYVSGQDFLAKDNVDIKIMAMAFCRLPNFRNVIISDGNRRIGAKELHRLMGRLWGTEVSLSGTHTLKAFMKALAEAGVELRKFKMVEAKRDRSARKENQSGQVPSNREKDFVVQRGFQCVTKKALQECFSDLPLPTMHALFRKVKFLKIEGQKQEMPISVGLEGEAISCYHSILEFAKNVERLELKSLGSNPDDDRTHPQLTTLIPRYEPCRISLLTLRVFWCTVGEAIHLFSCRAGSLVDVQLEFVEIKGGDWSVVLSSLRKYPFTKTQTFPSQLVRRSLPHRRRRQLHYAQNGTRILSHQMLIESQIKRMLRSGCDRIQDTNSSENAYCSPRS